MNWRTQLSNWYDSYIVNRGDENPKQEQLITKLSNEYTKYEMGSLGLGVIPFEPRKVDEPQIALLDVFQSLSDMSSGKGSKVPSPMIDAMYNRMRNGMSPILQERRLEFYKYDEIFSTCSTVSESSNRLRRGAFLGDLRIELIAPAEYREGGATSEAAEEINFIYQKDIAPIADNNWWYLLSNSLLRYGNAPIEIDATEQGRIIDLKQLSPYAMNINSNYNLDFYPGQMDCYEQFDDSGKNWLARWPKALIIWVMTQELAWHRFGSSRLFQALMDATSLMRAEATLPDNRDAGKLEKYEIHKDVLGNKVSNEDIKQARFLADQPKAPGATRIFNGTAEVGMLEPHADAYTKLEDIYHFSSGVAATFGTQFSQMRQGEKALRATLSYFDEKANVHQMEFRNLIIHQTVPQIVERLCAWNNKLAEQSTTFYGLDVASKTNANKYDAKKIKINILAQNNAPSDQLILNAGAGLASRAANGLDWDTFIESQALAQGKDPEMVKKGLIAEGLAPQYKLPNGIISKLDGNGVSPIAGIAGKPGQPSAPAFPKLSVVQ